MGRQRAGPAAGRMAGQPGYEQGFAARGVAGVREALDLPREHPPIAMDGMNHADERFLDSRAELDPDLGEALERLDRGVSERSS